MSVRSLLLPLALACLAAPAAHAWDCGIWTSNVPGMECYKAPAAATSATASQTQGQAQAQGQHQSATGGNATGGASSSTSTSTGGNASNTGNVQSSSESYSYPRQTPPAIAGTVQPTSSCLNAINGGASAPVAGLSFGFGHTDRECDLRESAREFYEMGRPDLAIELLCTSRAAQKLKDCQPLPAKPAPTDTAQFVTHQELRETERRRFEQQTRK